MKSPIGGAAPGRASRRPRLLIGVLAAGIAIPLSFAACDASSDDSEFTGGAGPTSGSGASGGAGGTPVDPSSSSGLDIDGGLGGSGGSITCTPLGPDDDVDQDGYTPNDGDCHDCDKNVNPNAIEVPTQDGKDVYDEDCDGQDDEVEEVLCDADLTLDEMDAQVAVQALELCKVSRGPADWGVVSAKWTMADGSDVPPGVEEPFHLGHGIVPAFGPNVQVRKGAHMLALSSGTARQPGDPGWVNPATFDKQYTGTAPQGFPKESPSCPNIVTGQPHDIAAVEVKLRTPANATGFSFDFDFFTFEWPGFVCSTYNDFFVALLEPFPANQMDGNISYDQDGNPVSVNNSLLQVCGCAGNPPADCEANGKLFPCVLGNSSLIGTGFGFDVAGDEQDHGATGWLQTKAPVEGGAEVTVRFMVYDSGDGNLDSTTLVDNFKWIGVPGVTVGTDPVPD
jgi:hypothetical protein